MLTPTEGGAYFAFYQGKVGDNEPEGRYISPRMPGMVVPMIMTEEVALSLSLSRSLSLSLKLGKNKKSDFR